MVHGGQPGIDDLAERQVVVTDHGQPLVTTGTLVSLDGGKLGKVKLPPYGVLVAELTA